MTRRRQTSSGSLTKTKKLSSRREAKMSRVTSGRKESIFINGYPKYAIWRTFDAIEVTLKDEEGSVKANQCVSGCKQIVVDEDEEEEEEIEEEERHRLDNEKS